MVVFGESQGALKILDAATGKLISQFTPGRGLLSAPLVDEAHDRIYFISGEANLYGLQVGWKPAPLIPYLR
jgi:outer membrane protein assembly factor BamB